MDFDPGTNVVNVLVARLRRRLEPWSAGLIQTVVGQGYALGERNAEDVEARKSS
jgi:DNA-binding response OmpR family regulator